MNTSASYCNFKVLPVFINLFDAAVYESSILQQSRVRGLTDLLAILCGWFRGYEVKSLFVLFSSVVLPVPMYTKVQ